MTEYISYLEPIILRAVLFASFETSLNRVMEHGSCRNVASTTHVWWKEDWLPLPIDEFEAFEEG